MTADTNFGKVLAQGQFAVTCEFNPPRGIQLESVLKNAALLKGKIDAVNVNDNSVACVRMSSWAVSKILLDTGIEPILQMTTRDRNRIALQSDLLGAAALGIQNILCLTGDHVSRGDHPEAKKVFDLDSIQLIATATQIRDQGLLMNGKKISGSPEFFIGGVVNPFVESLDLHVMRLQKKIAVGAQFIQTQPVLDAERFDNWLKQVTEKGLADQCSIIAGVIALKSTQMAQYLRDKVPGIMVPDGVIDRLNAVAEDEQNEEGIKICLEHIEKLKKTPGVKGVHIMAVGCEDRLAEIIERSRLLPRPNAS